MTRSRKKNALKARIMTVYVLCVLIFFGLWGRALFVQCIQGPSLASQANQQHWTEVYSHGQRGEILDCRGHLLAKSILVASVFARPGQVVNAVSVAKQLSEILELREEAILPRLQSSKSFVWIARQIGDDQAYKLRQSDIPGVYLTEEKRRFYPYGHLAGQLLGFVGVDNYGLEGLELSFNEYLSGKKRVYQVQRDGYGHLLYAPGQFDAYELRGRNIHLTIDTRIQLAVERALSHAVEAYKAKSGMGLVIEVETGAVRGWAHYPFFNPNNFQQYTSQDWRNRIVIDVFEPGSTLKPLLVAAALEEGVCHTDQIYFCENGSWKFHGHKIRDTHEYGWLPVNRIVRYSSNIGAGKISLDLGKKNYYRYLSDFGLSKSSGLPLPGENKGILRPPALWTGIDLVAAAFGQGLSVNTFQLASAFLCLANQGLAIHPHILEHPVQDHDPGNRILSPGTCQQVLKMMHNVVQADGTGTRARIEGFSVGGKTGTAQKAIPEGGYGNSYVASFVGLFPSMDPEYLILVVIDEPKRNHYGGVVAAPAVRDIGLEVITHSRAFRKNCVNNKADWKQGKPGQSELIEMTASKKMTVKSRQDILQDSEVPDFTGWSIRKTLELLGNNGIIPDLRGHGVFVTKQSPDPGQLWSHVQDSQWVLWLGDKSDT